MEEGLFNSTTNGSFTVFTSIYAWNSSKIIGILISLFNILFVTPFFCYIIWYERYGANHRRTLINQFVASNCYYAIAYLVIVQSLDVVTSAFGPFSIGQLGFAFCHVKRFIRSVIVFQVIQTIAATILIKYIYIFIVKNPSDVHDEYWCLFMNIWTLFVSLITQFVYQFLPGRNLTTIYVCTGYFDRSLLHLPVKVNQFTQIFMIVLIILVVIAFTKINLYKRKNRVETISPNAVSSWTYPSNVKQMLNTSLVNLATIAFALILIVPSVTVPLYLSFNDPELLNLSPNYQIYHFSDHGLILISMISRLAIHYVRNQVMRKTIFREIKDDLDRIKDWVL